MKTTSRNTKLQDEHVYAVPSVALWLQQGEVLCNLVTWHEPCHCVAPSVTDCFGPNLTDSAARVECMYEVNTRSAELQGQTQRKGNEALGGGFSQQVRLMDTNNWQRKELGSSIPGILSYHRRATTWRTQTQCRSPKSYSIFDPSQLVSSYACYSRLRLASHAVQQWQPLQYGKGKEK